MSLQSLPVKQLIKVLAHLRGGEIGFDPYRDPRTSKKEALLKFMLESYSNEAIIASMKAVTDAPAAQVDLLATVDTATWIRYTDPNGERWGQKFETTDAANRFINDNPANQYLGRYTAAQWKAFTETLGYVHRVVQARPHAKPTPSTPSPDTPKPSPTVTPEAQQLASLLASLAGTGKLDEARVKEICYKRAQDYVDNILSTVNTRLDAYDGKIAAIQMPVTVHVLKHETAAPLDLGHQHKAFPTLLKMAQARTRDGHRLNIWLKGPAGSGKTTAASKTAQALGLAFHFNGAISTEYELMGFKDASGSYHRTAFRDAFEHGGVYLFDEIDSSLPKAVLAFNAALANGQCRFPDAMVMRHADCVVLAGANTAGNGANSDYVGRMKQDSAFLNRFVLLDWPLDNALETALASNKDWVRKVQKFRSNAESRTIKGHIISPRATFYGEALLAAGIDEQTVEQCVLRGALSQDQWEQLCN